MASGMNQYRLLIHCSATVSVCNICSKSIKLTLLEILWPANGSTMYVWVYTRTARKVTVIPFPNKNMSHSFMEDGLCYNVHDTPLEYVHFILHITSN